MGISCYHVTVQTISIEHEVTSGIIILWRQHISARSHRDLPRPGWSLNTALSTHWWLHFKKTLKVRYFVQRIISNVEIGLLRWRRLCLNVLHVCSKSPSKRVALRLTISTSLGVLYMKLPYSWHFKYFVARLTGTVSQRLNAWQSEIFIYLGSVWTYSIFSNCHAITKQSMVIYSLAGSW